MSGYGGRLALIFSASTLVLLIAAFPLAEVAHQLGASNISGLVLAGPFAAVGAVLARKRPANPIGWLLLALGLLFVLCFDASMYSLLRYRLGHRSLPFGQIAVFLAPAWVPLVLLLPLPIALFPEGRMPTRKWRATVWAYFGLSVLWLCELAVVQFDALLLRPIRVDSSGVAVLVNNPTGSWQTAEHLSSALLVPYTLLAVVWIVRQIAAYRRARGVARQQLKWLFTGGSIAISGFLVAVVVGGRTGPTAAVVSDFGLVAVAALPLAIGVGILRYHLYEIDRLISRTISYLLVTGLLIGVFVGIVLLTTKVLPFSSPVGVAASTLAAAALFNPLRRRVQGLVDRRFNRSRYNAETVIAAFSERLRGAVDPEAVQTGLLTAVTRAIAPAHVSIWVRTPKDR